MSTSILTSIKELLGLSEDYEFFDTDVIMGINSAFFTLQQLGIGPAEGFLITNKETNWADYIPVDRKDLEAYKLYIYFKVKLSFDPPQNSFLLESINRQIAELEWRLNVQVDPPVAPL